MTSLPEPLAERLRAGRHDFHRFDADQHGIPPSRLASWVKAGHLRPLGGGDYVIDAPLEGESFYLRQREAHLRACASIVSGCPELYLVGRSSATAHGVAVLVEPDRVEVSKRPRPGRDRPVLLTRMPWGSPPLTSSGLRCQPLEEAVVEIAAMHGARAGLVTADAALHSGTTRDALDSAVRAFGRRPGRAAAALVAELADPRIESVGETLLRWEARQAMVELVPQVELRDAAGRFVARVDFLIAGTRVVVEFDGMGKYTSAEALRAEKRRQLALERLGYRVIRFSFDDLRRSQYIHSVLQRAAASA